MKKAFNKYCCQDQIKQDEIGEAFSTRGKNESRIQSFGRKPERKKLLCKQSVGRRVILKNGFFRNGIGRCGLDSSGSK
jgi:hypothetical protein